MTPVERIEEALRLVLKAGIGNSTDFEAQRKAHVAVRAALALVPSLSIPMAGSDPATGSDERPQGTATLSQSTDSIPVRATVQWDHGTEVVETSIDGDLVGLMDEMAKSISHITPPAAPAAASEPVEEVPAYGSSKETIDRFLEALASRSASPEDLPPSFGLSEECRLTGCSRSASDARAVPEGWKLVPIDPTPEMVEAGRIKMFTKQEVRNKWAAMLSAAPTGEGGDHE